MVDGSNADKGFLGRWSARKVAVKEGREAAQTNDTAPPKGMFAPAGPPAPADIPVAVDMPIQARTQTAAPNALASQARGDVKNDASIQQDQGRPDLQTAPVLQTAPALTLDDVVALTPASDYAAFVAKGVSNEVRNAAMKKLFLDPHYNIMDGLDIYIGDYNTALPMPQSIIDEITKDGFLNMFHKEAPPAEGGAGAPGHPPSDEASPLLSNLAPNLSSDLASNDPLTAQPTPAPPQPLPQPLPADHPESRPHDHPDLQLQRDHAAGPAFAGQSLERTLADAQPAVPTPSA